MLSLECLYGNINFHNEPLLSACFPHAKVKIATTRRVVSFACFQPFIRVLVEDMGVFQR